MRIDFHTHCYPPAIAAKTVEKLGAMAGKIYSDGTVEGLKKQMKDCSIDKSLILPVVVKSGQEKAVNEYAKIVNQENSNVISFGGIHPKTENYKEILNTLKEQGFLGIKLHPCYQQTYADDIGYLKIVEYATQLGLYCTFHAGIDVGLPFPFSTVDRLRNLLKETQSDKLIFAHLGGWKCWEEVEDKLIGENVLLDTAFLCHCAKENDAIEKNQLLKIIQSHGADKILFGSDSPWENPLCIIQLIESLPLSNEDKEKIFSLNALKILNQKKC